VAKASNESVKISRKIKKAESESVISKAVKNNRNNQRRKWRNAKHGSIEEKRKRQSSNGDIAYRKSSKEEKASAKSAKRKKAAANKRKAKQRK